MDQEQPLKRNKKSKSNTKIVIILAVILVLLIGFGGGLYLFTHQEEKAAAEQKAKEADPEKTQEQYENLKDQVSVDVDPNDPMNRKIDFSAAQATNPDVYAWIWIPGTNIDYPILQSETEPDEYYLDHTIERKAGLPGSIYTEKYNAKEFTDPVTIIYGHDMKNGSMFANLHNYEDQTFFDSNPYIYIYTPNQTFKYRVFAAVRFDDRYLMESYNFSAPEDFQKYLDELKSSIEGHINPEVNVTQQTGIITLSTCISDAPNNRWLVNATREEQPQ